MRYLTAVLLGLSLTPTFGFLGLRFQKNKETCRPLEISVCSLLGYNQTQTSSDVYLRRRRADLAEYITVLHKTRCSKDALFFMCMMYSPPCFEGFNDRVYPCRSVCQTVRDSCLYLIRRFQHDWPSELNCQKLPDHNTGVCISPNSIIQKNLPERKKNTIEESSKVIAPCSACPQKEPTIRFKDFKKANYVIKAVYESRATTAKGRTRMAFNVKDILKKGKVSVGLGKVVLFANSLCICPKLEFEETYYIIGTEDKKRKRLLFNKKVVILTENKHWNKKMKRWKRKFQRVLERRLKQRMHKFYKPQ